jgi:low temperature requirement protein LtrA
MFKIENEEKKVEYLELIYDLVFVYMVGRNNALLSHFENGFVSGDAFVAYVLCTLAIIQIWNFTTFYINMFGRNGIRDHVFLLINMYLMYFIGESTRFDWLAYQAQYHIAWALILANIGLQYLIEMRNHKADVWNRDMALRMAVTLFVEAAIALSAAFVPAQLVSSISFVAVFVGIVLTATSRKRSPGGAVDFMHLTERAMLYVVFTFGEMIIVISAYFIGDGSFNASIIYFSLMCFLIVAGLFVSYELIYDHLLDRERDDSGMLYMVIHIFILFALGCITVSLEFMREPEVSLLPKVIFITAAIIGYYAFLFCTGRYAKEDFEVTPVIVLLMTGLTVVFAVMMILFRENMRINIFVTVAYVWSIVAVLYKGKSDFERLGQ